jgi:AraC-like DNA-binding protein
MAARLAEPLANSCADPFVLAAYNAESLGEVLTCAERGMRSLSRSCELRYRPRAATGWAALEVRDQSDAPVQVIEHRIASIFHVLADITHSKAMFEIWFSHPPCAPLESYETYLPVRVRFNRRFNGIVVRTEALSEPLGARNKGIFKVAKFYIEQQHPEPSSDLVADVERVIAQLILQKRCTLQAVAAELETHPRSLQRHLNDMDKSFFEMKDEVRRKQALDALANCNAALKDIAKRLGYSTAAGFTRSCLRWFSAPPQKVRAKLTRDQLVNRGVISKTAA